MHCMSKVSEVRHMPAVSVTCWVSIKCNINGFILLQCNTRSALNKINYGQFYTSVQPTADECVASTGSNVHTLLHIMCPYLCGHLEGSPVWVFTQHKHQRSINWIPFCGRPLDNSPQLCGTVKQQLAQQQIKIGSLITFYNIMTSI